ncbi:zinc-ribbon domain-containing protein [Bacillus sp. Cr_A10]|uniref:zinc-ribbon domain-containing protein n=1 Tax=Bacillus sp. Cr_A10 TaxID=3033993 RepID=UPI0023DB2685|nr:zinc-ribbon domain-containing protein [Bacillus sp. Cr_A10]MDF2065095.1 zinc-ribbon domain-containing protein [Bacillus sp. Cr_A10]
MKKNNKELMHQMWDGQKNKQLLNLEFSDINTKDNKTLAYWICDFEGRLCSFRKTPNQVYKAIRKGSPVCNVCHELPFKKSVMYKAPSMVYKYWDNRKNAEKNMYPEYTLMYSNKEVYLHCEEHNWEGTQRCADLVNHIPCPLCNGQSATPDHNLQVLFPEVAKTLHSDYNPNLILPYSSKELLWWCDECNEYYIKSVSCRTEQNQGCPNHTINSSTEQLLRMVLNKLIGGFKKSNLKTIRWESNGNPVEIDLYNNILCIGIEFDGKQHDVRQHSDQKKNDMLANCDEVLHLIRIREAGLPNLIYFENQYEVVCCKHEYTYKFLVKPIQETLAILKEIYNLNITSYCDEEIYILIAKFLSKVSRSDYPSNKTNSLEATAPGLLRYIPDIQKYFSYGSNNLLEISCPNPDCNHPYSRRVKTFVKSKGLCPKCLFFVSDILNPDSPLVRWHPQNNML